MSEAEKPETTRSGEPMTREQQTAELLGTVVDWLDSHDAPEEVIDILRDHMDNLVGYCSPQNRLSYPEVPDAKA